MNPEDNSRSTEPGTNNGFIPDGVSPPPSPQAGQVFSPNQSSTSPASPASPQGEVQQKSDTNSTPVTPQTPPLVQPDTPPLSGSQPLPQPPIIYNSAPNQQLPTTKSKKVIILIAIILVAVLGGAGGYFILNNRSNEEAANNEPLPAQTQAGIEANIQVPEDWQKLQTDYGYSIKAPKTWELSGSGEANLNGQVMKSTSLGPPYSFSVSDPQPENPILISVGIGSLEQNNTKENYERSVSELTDENIAIFKEFGYNVEDVKYSSERLQIAGKNWIRVFSDIQNQYSQTLHLWVGDQAVVLSLFDENKKTLEENAKKYLLPLAASVELE